MLALHRVTDSSTVARRRMRVIPTVNGARDKVLDHRLQLGAQLVDERTVALAGDGRAEHERGPDGVGGGRGRARGGRGRARHVGRLGGGLLAELQHTNVDSTSATRTSTPSNRRAQLNALYDTTPARTADNRGHQLLLLPRHRTTGRTRLRSARATALALPAARRCWTHCASCHRRPRASAARACSSGTARWASTASAQRPASGGQSTRATEWKRK